MIPHTVVDKTITAGPLAFRPRRLAALVLSMQRAMPGWDLYGYNGHGAEALLGAAKRAHRESRYWTANAGSSKTASALAADYVAAAELLERRAARTAAGRVELGLERPVWVG